MKAFKFSLLKIVLILFFSVILSCKKKTESIVQETDSNNISFVENAPTLGTLPFVAQSRTNYISMAKHEGKIYVFLKTTAGGDFNVSGFTYDVNNNLFNPVKSLATGSFISSNGFNSTLLEVSNGLWYASPNVALLYSISTDSWTSYNSTAGANNGACVMLDKVYYAGNIYTGNGGLLASVIFNAYDYSKGTWISLASLPYLAENPVLQAYNNQFIYALGGEKNSANGITKKFSIYNALNDAWTALPNLPFDYMASKNNHSTTILKNKYMLAYSNNKVYLYNLETKQWNNNPVLDLGLVVEITNVNLFSNSTVNTDNGDAFYLAGTNINGEFKIKKYTIK